MVGGAWELPRKRQGRQRPGAPHAHRAPETETTDVIHTTQAGLQGEDPHGPLEGQERAPRRHGQPSGSLDSDNTTAVPPARGPTPRTGARGPPGPQTPSHVTTFALPLTLHKDVKTLGHTLLAPRRDIVRTAASGVTSANRFHPTARRPPCGGSTSPSRTDRRTRRPRSDARGAPGF